MRKTLRMLSLALAAACASLSMASAQRLTFEEFKNRCKTAMAALQGRLVADTDVLKIGYNVTIKKIDKDGNETIELKDHNLIVTAGKNKLLDAGAGTLHLKEFAYLGIGTGATAAAIGDTTLQTQLVRSTVITPTNPAANSLKFSFSFTGQTGAITECGLFTAAVSGTMLNRLVFAAVNITGTDTLVVEITIS